MGLDTVEFTLLVEDRFGLKLDDAALDSVRTVGELADLLHARLNPPGDPPGPDPVMVFGILEDLLVTHFRVPRDRISTEARFVADLGLQ
ncbi:MAG: acyl carrier protein [Zoogloeaceae bacterium]|nr:acyl carrier protein [Zoogloeaceae bacterium]